MKHVKQPYDGVFSFLLCLYIYNETTLIVLCWVILTWTAIWELLSTSSIWNGQTQKLSIYSFFGGVCVGVWTTHALPADQKFSTSAGSFGWLKHVCFRSRWPTGHTPWNTIRERAVKKEQLPAFNVRQSSIQVTLYRCIFCYLTNHPLQTYIDGKCKPHMPPSYWYAIATSPMPGPSFTAKKLAGDVGRGEPWLRPNLMCPVVGLPIFLLYFASCLWPRNLHVRVRWRPHRSLLPTPVLTALFFRNWVHLQSKSLPLDGI